MAAGGVEIVVGRPNKVQVVTLYGRPANLPGSLTKLVHAGGLIRLSGSGAGLGIPMSHGGKSFPSPCFPAERLLQSDDDCSSFSANNPRLFRQLGPGLV